MARYHGDHNFSQVQLAEDEYAEYEPPPTECGVEAAFFHEASVVEIPFQEPWFPHELRHVQNEELAIPRDWEEEQRNGEGG